VCTWLSNLSLPRRSSIQILLPIPRTCSFSPSILSGERIPPVDQLAAREILYTRKIHTRIQYSTCIAQPRHPHTHTGNFKVAARRKALWTEQDKRAFGQGFASGGLTAPKNSGAGSSVYCILYGSFEERWNTTCGYVDWEKHVSTRPLCGFDLCYPPLSARHICTPPPPSRPAYSSYHCRRP
jgi:hypothetical protein